MSMNKGQAVGLIEREIERFIASSFSKRHEEIVPVSASGLLDSKESVVRLILQLMIVPWFQSHAAEHLNSSGSAAGCYVCGGLWNEVERKYRGHVERLVHGKIHHLLAELELMG